jgi:antitoxin ChpS
MSYTARLRKVGGSMMLAIPPSVLDELGLRGGASVDLKVKSGKLLVEPRARPRFTLDELLAQCDRRKAKDSDAARWTNDRAQGRELL